MQSKSRSIRDVKEGDVIFATPQVEYAATFMTTIRWNDHMCKKGSFDNGPIYFVAKKKKNFSR